MRILFAAMLAALLMGQTGWACTNDSDSERYEQEYQEEYTPPAEYEPQATGQPVVLAGVGTGGALLIGAAIVTAITRHNRK